MGTHLGAEGVVWLMIWVFGCCGFIGYYGFRWCGDRRITIFPEGRDFTPRPERLPEGEAQGQSQGPRGAKFLHEGNLKVEEVCVGFLWVRCTAPKCHGDQILFKMRTQWGLNFE